MIKDSYNTKLQKRFLFIYKIKLEYLRNPKIYIMRKILLTLLYLPFIGFGQVPPCNASFSININIQDSNEVVYSVSGPNLNMNSDFGWVYFDMIGNCIGGGAWKA